jgi:hypothetical protein
MKSHTIHWLLLWVSICSFHCDLIAQPLKSRCGFVSKDSASLKKGYLDYYQHLGVMEGEQVASVGASGGSVELIISSGY